MNTNTERVAWLDNAWALLRERILPQAPEKAAITIGFPSKRALSKQKAIGECWGNWYEKVEGEEKTKEQIFFVSIHPLIYPQPITILQTLLHEMVHAVLKCEGGHGYAFKKWCDKLGFEGPATSNFAGPVLKVKLEEIAKELGPLPSGEGILVEKTKKPQTTRMRLYTCTKCGQKLRAAKDGLKIKHVDCEDAEFEQERLPEPDDDPEDDPKTDDAAEREQ